MRLILVFVLTVHAISGALITSNQSFTCPHQISESIKNDWKVEGVREKVKKVEISAKLVISF